MFIGLPESEKTMNDTLTNIDDDDYRKMASTLVDNLLAKAIVKASQKLAFTTTTNDDNDNNNNNNNEENESNDPNEHNCHRYDNCSSSSYQSIQTKRNVINPLRLKQFPSSPSSPSSTTISRRSSTPPMSSSGTTTITTSQSIDINGNTPEIQIDLVGPRTPSPVEESSFELPPVQRKQYKFKVETNDETHSVSTKDDQNMRTEEDNDNEMKHINNDSKNPNNEYYISDEYNNSDYENNNNIDDDYHESMAKQKDSFYEILMLEEDKIGHKKPMKSIQIVEMMPFSASQVDVATTPELEIDWKQAHEMSKSIVANIINQAVHRLNEDIKNHKHMKREPESISKISCYSSRSMAQNNCSWLTRTRHAIRRIMRHACICTRSKEDTFSHHHHQKHNNNDNNNA